MRLAILHTIPIVIAGAIAAAPIANAQRPMDAATRATATPVRAGLGFELHRAFPETRDRATELTKKKLPMPVLALAGDKSNGMTELSMAHELANDVHGGVAPETGHRLPDENPELLVRQLLESLPGPPG